MPINGADIFSNGGDKTLVIADANPNTITQQDLINFIRNAATDNVQDNDDISERVQVEIVEVLTAPPVEDPQNGEPGRETSTRSRV